MSRPTEENVISLDEIMPAAANPIEAENTDGETIYFSVFNENRQSNAGRRKKTIEELLQTLTHTQSEKRYTNATLANVNSNNPNAPRVNTIAQSAWPYLPALVIEDPLLIRYIPQNIVSDNINWPTTGHAAEIEVVRTHAKTTRSATPTTIKPSEKSALEKNKELYTRFRQADSTTNAIAYKVEEIEYVDTNGNKIRDNKRAAIYKNALSHNECHILPNITNVKAIALMKEDAIFNETDDVDTVKLKLQAIKKAVELRNAINKKKQETSDAAITKIEKSKNYYLQHHKKYYLNRVKALRNLLKTIQAVRDQSFNPANVTSAEFRTAFQRKINKYPNFAIVGKNGKTNAIYWIENNIKKSQAYYQELEEYEDKTLSPAQIAKRVAALRTPTQFAIYDVQNNSVEYYDDEKFQEKLINNKFLLYKLFKANFSAEEIRSFLLELKLHPAHLKQLISYHEAQNPESFNILYAALQTGNQDSINLALHLIELYDPAYHKKLPIHFNNILTKAVKEYPTHQRSPETAVKELFNLLNLSIKFTGDYSKDLLISILQKINFYGTLNYSLNPILQDFLSKIKDEDRLMMIDLFVRKNSRFDHERYDGTTTPAIERFVRSLKKHNIEQVILEGNFFNRETFDGNIFDKKIFLQTLAREGIQVHILAMDFSTYLFEKEFKTITQDISTNLPKVLTFGLGNSIKNLVQHCLNFSRGSSLLITNNLTETLLRGIRDQRLFTMFFEKNLDSNFLNKQRMLSNFSEVVHSKKLNHIIIDLDVADTNFVKTFSENFQRRGFKILYYTTRNRDEIQPIVGGLEVRYFNNEEEKINDLNKHLAHEYHGKKIQADIFCANSVFEKITPHDSTITHGENSFYQYSFDKYLSKELKEPTPIPRKPKVSLNTTAFEIDI